ncbi:MAG TPA: endopeptidase La [Candidatus Faecousia intestinavium]|nr:endopeptidase La [Candidatus Faecousia intestinavium]
MPILALRGLAVFPEQTVHFDVGREKSVRALEAAMKADQTLFLIPQKDLLVDDPKLKDLYAIGTVAKVKQVLKTQGENLRILVTGVCRGKITELQQSEPYLEGLVEAVSPSKTTDNVRAHALRREAVSLYGLYLQMSEHPAQAIQLRMMASEDTGFIADAIAQNSGIDFPDKAKMLCQLNPVKRLEAALRLLSQEVEMLRLESDIQEKTRSALDQNQRDYYIREQIKVLQDELGEADEASEFENYIQSIKNLHLSEELEKKLLKDVDRLKKQPFGSSEGAVLRNYLDTVLDLPWNQKTKERVDVAAAKKILEHDHFGLEKVKERILETIAVRQMAPEMPPQILCLVGPPGVGKTSISYSIARSLNRKMARISLGGVHDEADIRGHRKTYVGAMPGRIMAAMAQAGSANPVLLLDEIDKMGSDYRGDPSAALLEVLDAEQNHTYRDHYLEIPFDLSDVMFITTANTLDTVPRPLLDRMEIIELGSYTDEEKLMIAKNHLIPKQLKKHGLKKQQLRISDDAIREIISCYTRESGVRNLERAIGEICRKTDMQLISQEESKRISVTGSNLETFLGVRKYLPDRLPCTDEVGLVTGLAWTSVGGETLEVEVNVMDGSGKLELTGNLGDVMKESAHAALSYIRANAQKLGVAPDFYKTKDVHVHFPEGAVPKDGPSAGVTVCTAMVSALTGVSVRRDVAMTGEISLRGRVMRIGGLKEKTMAALRHGVRTVIIPKDNERDLEEIDQTVRRQLNFISAQTVDTVLEAALNRQVELRPGILTELPEEMASKTPKPGLQQ